MRRKDAARVVKERARVCECCKCEEDRLLYDVILDQWHCETCKPCGAFCTRPALWMAIR